MHLCMYLVSRIFFFHYYPSLTCPEMEGLGQERCWSIECLDFMGPTTLTLTSRDPHNQNIELRNRNHMEDYKNVINFSTR